MPNYGIFGTSALDPACPLRLAPEGTGGVGTEWGSAIATFTLPIGEKPSSTDFACQDAGHLETGRRKSDSMSPVCAVVPNRSCGQKFRARNFWWSTSSVFSQWCFVCLVYLPSAPAAGQTEVIGKQAVLQRQRPACRHTWERQANLGTLGSPS